MSERPGKYQRSFPGMIGAMLVLLIAVAGFTVFREAVRDEPADPVTPVDYLQPAEFAREAADFPVLVPPTLPEGWIATSVQFVDGVDQAWRLGLLTEDQKFVGLRQESRRASELVEDYVDEDAVQGDDITVDGTTWQTWTDEGGDTALVRETDDVTTLVVGTVGEDTLVSFIRSLR